MSGRDEINTVVMISMWGLADGNISVSSTRIHHLDYDDWAVRAACWASFQTAAQMKEGEITRFSICETQWFSSWINIPPSVGPSSLQTLSKVKSTCVDLLH